MFTYKKDGFNVPVKSWIPEKDYYSDVAMVEQCENLARLPFSFGHVVLCPDGHVGFGCPIGSVVATKAVIIPNVCGVDIGAVDRDTEILTKSGWITIDKYNNIDDVLIYDNYKQTSFFSKPLLYIVKPCEDFTEYKSKYGLDQVLSDEHRMLVYEGYGKDRTNNTYFCKDFREKLSKLKKQDYYSVRTTFATNEKGIKLTDEQIAIMVMVSADGHIRKQSSVYTNVEMHFKKSRKINRCKVLLNKAKVSFKEYDHSDKTKSIIFKLDWECKKELTALYLCNQHQAKVVFDEYLYWDGTIDKKRNHKMYSTTKKVNADVVQYICAVNGVRAGIHLQSYKNENWNDSYSVYQTRNEYVGFSRPQKIKIPNGNKYCFVVETGYFVARRNNKIFVTGNCGMIAVKTSLTELDRETLKKILGNIRQTIPVGFEHHKTDQDITLMPNYGLGAGGEITGREYMSALRQIGTLGGGNHFIEIQKGDDGHIWIMIHSGSRNLGKQVADYYNKVAIELNEKYHSSVPNEWQLAFLPVDSQEGQNYISEMNYCVEFALANRQLMMSRIIDIFCKHTELAAKGWEPPINIAHNYAKQENHYGQNLWVHRKGATLAQDGTIGIIPGSQGSSSFIVKGKGSKESFNSCSHGAGRLMSRTKAMATLNLEDEIKKLDDQGILHAIRGKKDLDEASGSYKNVEEVMNNQSDLVDILVKLSPMGVVKG